MKLDFYIRFHTKFGQKLALLGNLPALGNDELEKALPMSFYNDECWHASIEIDPDEADHLNYRYVFFNEKGEAIREAERERSVDLKKGNRDLVLMDTWNDNSFFENAFYTTPFTEVFFREHKKVKVRKNENATHYFRVKAPLLEPNECLCMTGTGKEMNDWSKEQPLFLHKKGNWWTTALDLSAAQFPIAYKYGIYNLKTDAFVGFEGGDNRILHRDASINARTIIHDGFARFPNNTWKGAGVAIPVFSLRSNNSFGIGEFTDIKLLVDWAVETGLKLIQLLPINDTTATFTWKDSYPYAAISAFALHPIYMNLQKVAGKKNAGIVKSLAKKQKQLNSLPEIDYEQVMQFKTNVLRELFDLDGLSFLKEAGFKDFFEDNGNWLMPYAAFCYLRDKYGTSDFSKWKTHSVYNPEEIEKLCSPKSKTFHQIAFYVYVQYHLHLQLRDAAVYAHKKGIAFKGDIPIGIYRYGCDAWTAPELYNMDMQAGAPPDDFTIRGQNWGFPTYNWKKMEEDHFEWWRQRFHQMSSYFDAFRIDHILGFFRIWSIPVDSVEGILGRFIPAVPVHVNEFGERGIWFDHDRFCKPYIVDSILHQTFGQQADFVKEHFLSVNTRSGYDLLPEFDTQAKVADYFSRQEQTPENEHVQQGLYDLITNVLLYEEAGSGKQKFHFRIHYSLLIFSSLPSTAVADVIV